MSAGLPNPADSLNQIRTASGIPIDSIRSETALARLNEFSCERILWAEIDRSLHVANLTQYVLPVLYGFLGAMAAAMRLLRRKVDAFLLSYTDRARLQQGAILGVLCGAVIGLFATFLGEMGGTGSVGTAALALLAGYNVDGVFRFLDELSDRLFRPATPAKLG